MKPKWSYPNRAIRMERRRGDARESLLVYSNSNVTAKLSRTYIYTYIKVSQKELREFRYMKILLRADFLPDDL